MEEHQHRHLRGALASDLGIALALLAAAVALSAWFGIVVARLERPRNVLIEAIPVGPAQAYFFQRAVCFGDVSTELKAGQNASLNAHATVRTDLRGRAGDVTGHLFAHFNPLGQLVRGEATVQAPDVSAAVKVTGVTPLKLALAATIGERSISRHLTLPGPVTLVRNDESTFRLEYAQLPFGTDNSTTQVMRRLVEGELTIMPAGTVATTCDGATAGRFDLTQLNSKLGPLMGALTEQGGTL